MLTRLIHYDYLLSLTYAEAVKLLLERHGNSSDDYYREKSYDRFLKREIKTITRGKYSKTSEGLFCHHIAENKYLNLSDTLYILRNKYSFELQKKEQLVYCDLFEHIILHALIAKETEGKYGTPGYDTYLYPMIVEWYVGRVKPQKKEWLINCYERAFLTPDEARNLLIKINWLLPEKFQNTGDIIYISPEEKHEQNQKRFLENKIRWERESEIRRKEQIILEEKKVKKRTEEFYLAYPLFEKMNIIFDSPRNKVMSLLYDFKYSETYKNKKEFDSAMKPVIKDLLFDELHSAILNKESC